MNCRQVSELGGPSAPMPVQIEKYADIYTSRVSNLGRYSPYMYFRSPSQSLVHDRHSGEGALLDSTGDGDDVSAAANGNRRRTPEDVRQ